MTLASRQELWRDLRAAGRELMVCRGATARSACKRRMVELTAAIAALPAANIPDAPAAASLTAAKEAGMAKDDDGPGEYKRPDAAKAFEIYNKQIKPKLAKIDTARGECSQPWQDIKEHANFPRPVMNFLIMLESIDDDAKRDHFLLALSDGLKVNKRFLPRDLVTMASGQAEQNIVGTEDRDDTGDLATLEDEEEEDESSFEMSEEELSKQADRPSVQEAKAEEDRKSEAAASGTGAAARAAMSASAKPETPKRKRSTPEASSGLTVVH